MNTFEKIAQWLGKNFFLLFVPFFAIRHFNIFVMRPDEFDVYALSFLGAYILLAILLKEVRLSSSTWKIVFNIRLYRK